MSGPVTILGADGRNNAPDNPVYVQLAANGGGTLNFPVWSKVGELLEGQIEAGVEKDVLPNGATAIWIQASPDNTDAIRVGTVPGFSAAWLQPGDSEWYYGSAVYLNCASAASFATQAVSYSAT